MNERDDESRSNPDPPGVILDAYGRPVAPPDKGLKRTAGRLRQVACRRDVILGVVFLGLGLLVYYFREKPDSDRSTFSILQDLGALRKDFVGLSRSTIQGLTGVDDQDRENIQRIGDLLAQGEDSQAERLLGGLEMKYEDLAAVDFYRGLLASKRSRNEEALKYFQSAIDRKHDFPEAWNNRGASLRELQRLPEALVSFRVATSLKASFLDAWVNQSDVLHIMGDARGAIAACDSALAFDPCYSFALLNRAAHVLLLGDKNGAISAFERAIGCDDRNVYAWYGLGTVQYQEEHFEESLKALNRALLIQPQFPEALVNKALALKELGRLDEALAATETACSMNPQLYEAWQSRGDILMSLKRYSESAKAFEKAKQFARGDLRKRLAETGLAEANRRRQATNRS